MRIKLSIRGTVITHHILYDKMRVRLW